MPACKACGHWFVKIKPQEELCDKCESALYRLSGYVAPVVHGRWIHYPDCGVTRCSHCGWSIEECWESKHCPECGAKIDLEEEE